MGIRKSILSVFVIIFLAVILTACGSQRGGRSSYQKFNRSYYKQRYASNAVPAERQCFRLFKKKTNMKPRKVPRIAASGKKKKQPVLAEVDYNEKPATPAPKPKPKPQPKPQPMAEVDTQPDISHMNIQEKHDVEDNVLKKNNLPAPTSAKHEQIRKEVEKHLANFENEKPIKLEPLYFLTGQDEFAFVDMDPFLVAVEYALQGKMILIEGHTDHVGDFKANVALSIKRVEKIRELMIQMGVEDDKISVVGYGEELSAESQSADKKQEERRVDFTVF